MRPPPYKPYSSLSRTSSRWLIPRNQIPSPRSLSLSNLSTRLAMSATSGLHRMHSHFPSSHATFRWSVKSRECRSSNPRLSFTLVFSPDVSSFHGLAFNLGILTGLIPCSTPSASTYSHFVPTFFLVCIFAFSLSFCLVR